MTEYPIPITWLNDCSFCPASIYFHNLYGEKETVSFQETSQINGAAAHASVDSGRYSTRADVLSGISVYSEKYGLVGKIDVFDKSKGILRERKKKIRTIYDGFIFQLYGQYYALREMGYTVNKLMLYSLDDNRSYTVKLPENDPEMFEKFENAINEINNIDLENFTQTDKAKCRRCIYEPLCDSSLFCEDEQ